MTTIPTITPLPTPVPQTSDPDNFDERADELIAALPTFGSETNATVAAINIVAGEVLASAGAAAASAAAASADRLTAQAAAGLAVSSTAYVATSGSNLSIGTGTKAFALNETARGFQAGDQLVAVRRSDRNARMYGAVSTYASDVVTLNVTSVVGAGGPFADWVVYEASFDALPAATAAGVRAGTSGSTTVTPAALMASAAFQTLTDAATIAWDAAQGYNARVVLGASGHTVGAPTSLSDGLTYTLEIVQDATGSRTVNWNAIWDFGAAGLPQLQVTGGKADKVHAQYNSRTGKLEANFRKGA